MSLKQKLKDSSYDLIDSPIRNHKPIQLWLKKNFDKVDLYYENIYDAFNGPTVLKETTNQALTINAQDQEEYNFNVGITFLDNLLDTLRLGTFDLSAKIQSGKTIKIGYDHARTVEYPIGKINEFFDGADFNHSNKSLLKSLNRNDVIVITGVLFAKNFAIDIEANHAIEANLALSLNSIAGGKVEFSKSGNNKLSMKAKNDQEFPIAVKAHRLVFNGSHFEKSKLITDSRTWF